MRAVTALLLLVVFAGCGGPEDRLALETIELERPTGSGEPHLYAAADGRALLSWLEPTEDGHALKAAVRDRSGWSEPRTVVAERDFFVNWADFPSLIELEDGSWLIHWLEKVADDTYAYHVKMAHSRDRGATWSEPFVPHRDDSPTEHGFVSMVPWRDGAALVWLDGRKMADAAGAAASDAAAGHALDAGEMTIRATTLDASGALGPDVLLDGRTCECCQTALVRAGDDLVAAYRDRSLDEIRDIAVVRHTDGGWTEPVHVADDGWHFPGCPVNGPQLAARGDTVVVTWFTAADNAPRVFAAFSHDRGATWGPPIRVDDGDPLGRVDVELLTDGRAVVVWLGRTDADAAILARSVREGGATGPPLRVSDSSESRGSGVPRTARVGDTVLVAWTLTGDDGGVRVASIRAECAGWNRVAT